MVATIATLLEEFEDGQITRRQLIQSLAVRAGLQISNQTTLG